MEGGFKARHLNEVRIARAQAAHGAQIDGVVRRSVHAHALHLRQHFRVHNARAGQFPAVHGLVAHRVQIAHGRKRAQFHQRLEAPRERILVRAALPDALPPRVPRREAISAFRRADVFHAAAGQQIEFPGEQFEFVTGRTQVEDDDVPHGVLPFLAEMIDLKLQVSPSQQPLSRLAPTARREQPLSQLR